MSLSNVYQLFKNLEKDSILLSFKGIVTADLLTSVLEIMESKLSSVEGDTKIRKKVFNVLVECLQNLYHHIDLHEEEITEKQLQLDSKSAIFKIARIGPSFYVRTGNYVHSSESVKLNERLDRINGMEKEELRMYYQEILGRGILSDKGTAGLGMIDIARKSGNKLEYEMIDVSEEFQFFCLNVKID